MGPDRSSEPVLSASQDGSAVLASHDRSRATTPSRSGRRPTARGPTLLFCENETNVARIDGAPPTTPYPKDGINDHVDRGRDDGQPGRGPARRPRPGTRSTVPAGGSAEIRLRLTRTPRSSDGDRSRGDRSDGATGPARRALRVDDAQARGRGRRVLRGPAPTGRRPTRRPGSCARRSRGCSGASSTTATTWPAGWTATRASRRRRPSASTAGTPAGATSTRPTSCRCPTRGSTRGSRPGTSRSTRSPSPTSTRRSPSTSCWCCAASGSSTRTARCPPTSGRSTTSTRRSTPRPRYMVWHIDGRRDIDFLKRIFHKLLLNFTWWLNREDKEGNDLFSGGFLGLDNIGAFDRSHLPAGMELEQSDATAWMFLYCISMLRDRDGPGRGATRPTRTSMTTFLEHARADLGGDEPERAVGRDGRLLLRRAASSPTGRRCRSRSTRWSGCIPLLPSAVVPMQIVRRGQALGKRFAALPRGAGRLRGDASAGRLRQRRPRSRVAADQRGPAGPPGDAPARDVRRGCASSRRTACARCRSATSTEPFQLELGGLTAQRRLRARRIDVGAVRRQLELARPGLVADPTTWSSSRSANWDAWFGATTSPSSTRPVRARRSGCATWPRTSPAGSSSIWLPDADGRRPVYGSIEKFQTDPEWRDLLLFHEYFHGDTGAGIGASHQTGWTGSSRTCCAAAASSTTSPRRGRPRWAHRASSTGSAGRVPEPRAIDRGRPSVASTAAAKAPTKAPTRRSKARRGRTGGGGRGR